MCFKLSFIPDRLWICRLTCSVRTESRSLSMDTLSKLLTGTPKKNTHTSSFFSLFVENFSPGGFAKLWLLFSVTCVCSTCQGPGFRRGVGLLSWGFIFYYDLCSGTDCKTRGRRIERNTGPKAGLREQNVPDNNTKNWTNKTLRIKMFYFCLYGVALQIELLLGYTSYEWTSYFKSRV